MKPGNRAGFDGTRRDSASDDAIARRSKTEFVNSEASFARAVVDTHRPAIRLTWAHPQFGFAIRRKARLLEKRRPTDGRSRTADD